MRSIRQSVQTGQFLGSFAQNAPHLLIASHTHKRIERLFVQVIVTAPTIDETPTLQPSEPAYDRSAGHAHIGSNLGDRKRLTVDVTNRHAEADKECLKVDARVRRVPDVWRGNTYRGDCRTGGHGYCQREW